MISELLQRTEQKKPVWLSPRTRSQIKPPFTPRAFQRTYLPACLVTMACVRGLGWGLGTSHQHYFRSRPLSLAKPRYACDCWILSWNAGNLGLRPAMASWPQSSLCYRQRQLCDVAVFTSSRNAQDSLLEYLDQYARGREGQVAQPQEPLLMMTGL